MNRQPTPLFSKLAFVIAALFGLNVVAVANISMPQKVMQPKQSLFEENKGQITDQYGNPRPDVRYVYAAPGFKAVMKPNGFSYEVYTIRQNGSQPSVAEASGMPEAWHHKQATDPNVVVQSHQIDIHFVGANPHAQLVADIKSESYNNYMYMGTSGVSRSITNVHSYQELTYKNIYPNIDIRYMANKEGQLKYDIIVHPGGKLSDVKLDYQGMQALALTKEGLKLNTSQGFVEERIPASFLEETHQPVAVAYAKKGNSIMFVGKYDHTKTLVVDPAVLWSTYYGGSKSDNCEGGKSDRANHVYIFGQTRSANNIAFSGLVNEYLDPQQGFVVKMDYNGKRIWATYFLGPGGAGVHTIDIDDAGFVYLGGKTGNRLFPVTSNAYKVNHSVKGNDAYLVKINSGGNTVLWSTLFADMNSSVVRDEDILALAVSRAGDVYITGYTEQQNLATTTGSHQAEYGGGTYDVFIAKFSTDCQLRWSTFLGGSGTEQAVAIALDTNENLYVGGYTSSTTAIATAGAQQETLAGGNDAFIAKFTKDGTRLWGTYFGANLDDRLNGFSLDRSGSLYIVGDTKNSTNIATAAAHQTVYGGNEWDAMLAKFNTDNGKVAWATYMGGEHWDLGNAVATDDSSNVYITGYTRSTNGIVSTGAVQAIYGGGLWDAYVAKFNGEGKRQWSTYYGYSGDDITYGIELDKNRNVYIFGNTTSESGLATTGAHQKTFGGLVDAFLVKFSQDSPATPIAPTLAEAHDAHVYPMPSAGLFVLELGAGTKVNAIRICDALGKTIFQKSYTQGTHIAGREVLDLQAYPAGTYNLYISTSASPIVRKLIVQR